MNKLSTRVRIFFIPQIHLVSIVMLLLVLLGVSANCGTLRELHLYQDYPHTDIVTVWLSS